jgi:hypothetical protein
MNDPLDLSDLETDDVATAAALQAAFSGVTLDRPTPGADVRVDEDTAAAIQHAFGDVVLDRPVPTEMTRADVIVLPARPRRRPLAWLVAAAAAVVALTVALTLLPGRDAVAWASEPSTATAADVVVAQKACSAPLARGLGDLQQSGSASVDGTTPAAPPPSPGDAGPPTALPPLAVLDVRGDGALAVYQDATWQVVCLLRRENGTWVDQGISVGPGRAAAPPGLVFGGGTSWAGGDQVSYVGGAVPTGTATVTFTLSDGSTVRASLLGTTFAAWFPGGASVVPGSLAAFDATGTKLA